MATELEQQAKQERHQWLREQMEHVQEEYIRKFYSESTSQQTDDPVATLDTQGTALLAAEQQQAQLQRLREQRRHAQEEFLQIIAETVREKQPEKLQRLREQPETVQAKQERLRAKQEKVREWDKQMERLQEEVLEKFYREFKPSEPPFPKIDYRAVAQEKIANHETIHMDGHNFVQVDHQLYKAVEPYYIGLNKWVFDEDHYYWSCVIRFIPREETPEWWMWSPRDGQCCMLYYIAKPGVGYRLNRALEETESREDVDQACVARADTPDYGDRLGKWL